MTGPQHGDTTHKKMLTSLKETQLQLKLRTMRKERHGPAEANSMMLRVDTVRKPSALSKSFYMWLHNVQ